MLAKLGHTAVETKLDPYASPYTNIYEYCLKPKCEHKTTRLLAENTEKTS